jgi:hypothetical protein
MLTKMTIRWIALTFIIGIVLGIRPGDLANTTCGQGPQEKDAPATNQQEGEYVGLTKCAACHFPQYKVWKTSTHGKAFDILPAKYRQDAECLKCHTTGYGHPSGSNDALDAAPTGISCEACHGPGGEHSKNALRFVDEGITEAGMNRLRSSIQRVAVDQCIKCHVGQAHKEHPPFERDEPAAGANTGLPTPRSKSFFSLKAH